MWRVLIPVDGSPDGPAAVRHVLDTYADRPGLELHLFHARPALRRYSARKVARADRRSWHEHRALAAMAGARALLDQRQLAYRQHWCVGDPVAEIARHADRLKAQRIVFSSRPRGWSGWLLSTPRLADRVAAISNVPLDVVDGAPGPRWERWIAPAGLLGFGGLLLFALED